MKSILKKENYLKVTFSFEIRKTRLHAIPFAINKFAVLNYNLECSIAKIIHDKDFNENI